MEKVIRQWLQQMTQYIINISLPGWLQFKSKPLSSAWHRISRSRPGPATPAALP